MKPLYAQALDVKIEILGKRIGEMMTEAEQLEIDNWFAYHPPSPEKLALYNHVRTESKKLAAYVIDRVPASADRTAVIRSLRNTVMAINLSIACND